MNKTSETQAIETLKSPNPQTIPEQQLLTTFPRPPSHLSPSPTPTRSKVPSPSPSPRPSDFGFIHVGLSSEVQGRSSSIYDNDTFIPAPAPAPVPTPVGNTTNLQLILDNPAKLYAPGEAITGYITGWNYASEPSTHVHIVLEGRAKTWMHADALEHRDCAPLLYQVAHFKPADQGIVPRFSITIPEKAAPGLSRLNDFAPESRTYWTHEWPAQNPYESQSGHPLPPSMSLPLRTSTNLTSRIAGRGCIEYKLIAVRSTLFPDSGKLVPEATFQLPIHLTTLRLPHSRVQDLMSTTHNTTTRLHIQTAQLLKEKRLSICEQVRDAFATSTPGFYFSSTVTTPQLTIPGADVKIGVSVAILPPPFGKLYNFPVPDICITRLDVRVRSYQGLRSLRPPLSNPNLGPTKSHTFKTWELRTVKEPPDAVFHPKKGDFENQTCIITVALPKTILPSFKTYNLWRSYRLECDVTFKVAGKECTAKMKSDLNIAARAVGSREMGVEGAGMESEGMSASLEMAEEVVRRWAGG